MRQKLLCLLFTASLFSACQKELSLEQGINTPVVPATGDSSYLSKMYELDDLNPGVDTFAVHSFFYDGSKRLVMIADSNSNGLGIFDLTEKKSFFYNGSDTVPFKATFSYTDQLPGGYYLRDSSTIWYFYDAAGRLMKDSAVGDASDNIGGTVSSFHTEATGNYTYSGANIYYTNNHARTQSPGGTIITVSRDTALVDAQGNIIKDTRYATGISGTDTTVYTFTYDNNPNPFGRFTFAFGRYNTLSEGLIYTNGYKYNRLLYTRTGRVGGISTTSVSDYTGFYQYKTNRLPASLKVPDPSSPGSYIVWLAYKYVSL